jgi:hypothetical protein
VTIVKRCLTENPGLRRLLRPVKRAVNQVIAGERRQRLNALMTAAKARHHPGLPKILILGDLVQYGLHVSMLHKALVSLKADVTFDDLDAPLAFKWAPWSQYSIPDEVRARLKARKIVNDTHFSCDKDNVAHCFAASFGYSLAVDPNVTRGPMVRKSLRNAAHDGTIVNGPIAAETGFSYAALIRNEIGDLVEDVRLPIVGRTIPFAYLKYRPTASRFSNKNTYAGLVGCASVLSTTERTNVLEFARLIGLEFGEVDALRDRVTNRLYIVDANNTASGPPNGLPVEEAVVAIDLIADAIVQEFVAPLVGPFEANHGVR